ncbi:MULTISPECIES: hypothetical protein [unclassified Arenibacter]|uniref:hypothetical protein n=1 Tax=unclassified Arenibacter TaxID=2615047 RepID=UPI0011C1C6A6|nr:MULTISPECIES: hypothetical protein [unclassified Arenibacter]
MIHSLPHRRIHIAATVVLLISVLISCGSYQQASYYDNDGIYSNNSEQVRVTEQRPRAQQPAPKPNAYGDYFGQKANDYGEILDSEVFTDVDGYYSDMETDSLNYDQDLSYNAPNNDYNGYGSWGDNATNVNINIYDDWGWGGAPFTWGYGGFYGGLYGGFYNPWRWNRFGYGYGWNDWGWGGYGWNNWGWGGYGWNNWGWGGYGWGGYYYPYHYSRNRFGNFYNRSYAYNASRRGVYNSNTRLRSTALSGRSNITADRTGSSRYRSSAARSNVGVDALERNRSYRTSRSTRAVPNYNNSSRSNQTYRSSSSNSGTYRGTAPRTSTYRSSASSRSSNSTYRSSTPTRSSSGNYRSSSSSTPTRSSSSTYRSSGSSSSSSGSIRSSGGSSSRSSSSGSRSSGRRN